MKDCYIVSFYQPTNIMVVKEKNRFYYDKNNSISAKEFLFLQKIMQEQNKVEQIDELIVILAKQFKKTDEESILDKEVQLLKSIFEKMKENNIIQLMKKGTINDVEWKYSLQLFNQISIYSNLETNEPIHKNIINRDIIEDEKYQLINLYISNNKDKFETKENIINVTFEDYLFFIAIKNKSNLLEVFKQYKNLMIILHHENIKDDNHQYFYNQFLKLLVTYNKHIKLIKKEVN